MDAIDSTKAQPTQPEPAPIPQKKVHAICESVLDHPLLKWLYKVYGWKEGVPPKTEEDAPLVIPWKKRDDDHKLSVTIDVKSAAAHVRGLDIFLNVFKEEKDRLKDGKASAKDVVLERYGLTNVVVDDQSSRVAFRSDTHSGYNVTSKKQQMPQIGSPWPLITPFYLKQYGFGEGRLVDLFMDAIKFCCVIGLTDPIVDSSVGAIPVLPWAYGPVIGQKSTNTRLEYSPASILQAALAAPYGEKEPIIFCRESAVLLQKAMGDSFISKDVIYSIIESLDSFQAFYMRMLIVAPQVVNILLNKTLVEGWMAKAEKVVISDAYRLSIISSLSVDFPYKMSSNFKEDGTYLGDETDPDFKQRELPNEYVFDWMCGRIAAETKDWTKTLIDLLGKQDTRLRSFLTLLDRIPSNLAVLSAVCNGLSLRCRVRSALDYSRDKAGGGQHTEQNEANSNAENPIPPKELNKKPKVPKVPGGGTQNTEEKKNQQGGEGRAGGRNKPKGVSSQLTFGGRTVAMVIGANFVEDWVDKICEALKKSLPRLGFEKFEKAVELPESWLVGIKPLTDFDQLNAKLPNGKLISGVELIEKLYDSVKAKIDVYMAQKAGQ